VFSLLLAYTSVNHCSNDWNIDNLFIENLFWCSITCKTKFHSFLLLVSSKSTTTQHREVMTWSKYIWVSSYRIWRRTTIGSGFKYLLCLTWLDIKVIQKKWVIRLGQCETWLCQGTLLRVERSRRGLKGRWFLSHFSSDLADILHT